MFDHTEAVAKLNDLRAVLIDLSAEAQGQDLAERDYRELGMALAGVAYIEQALKAANARQTDQRKHGLTPASLDLFIAFAKDAPNWNGMPLIDCLTKQERGNLTDLVRRDLISVAYEDDGSSFAVFQPKGHALAAELNIDLY